MQIKNTELLEMYQKGFSVKELALKIGKSPSTVYKYLTKARKEVRYPTLRNEIKQALLCGDFKKYITT